MKAVLLAAGLGTRLRPLTNSTPKCLIEVAGRALLDIWLDSLARVGVNEVLVNSHYLSERVVAHLARRDGSPPEVRVAHEPDLLGSAGTLLANRDFLSGEDMFLALNADNLTDFDLHELVRAHEKGGSLATIAVFQTPRPSECGIVEVRGDLITSFEEKPARPRSDLANAGMYAFRPDVLDLIEGGGPRDIGYDLLPRLVGQARAVSIGSVYFADIGTPEALERARHEWQGGQLR